jgi:hypothetical protein
MAHRDQDWWQLLFRHLFHVFPDRISEKNEQDRKHTLNHNWYHPGSSGIAVRNARVNPGGCANCHSASQNINDEPEFFWFHNRPEKDGADPEDHCAEETEVSI